MPLLIPKAFSLSNAVVREDKLWFYSVGTADVGRPQKAGIDVPRNDWKYYLLLPQQRTGLSGGALERHFVSLDAMGRKGTTQTVPFALPAEARCVNVDAVGVAPTGHRFY